MIRVSRDALVPRDPFLFGGWDDPRLGIGEVAGADGRRFRTQDKKSFKKRTAGAGQNWTS